MKSVQIMEGFKPEIGPPFDCRGKKRWMGFKEVPLSCSSPNGTGKTDTPDGNLMSELSLLAPGPGSSDQSSNQLKESGGSPVGVLVAGGEVSVEEESNTLSCLSHGSISMIGRRREMEDAVTVDKRIVAGEFAFFAVYDGHGGSRVADACRDRLHQLVAKEIGGGRELPDKTTGGGDDGSSGRMDWEKVMVACFTKMDEEVNGSGDGSGFEMQNRSSVSVRTIGSTAVVVVVGKEELVVANCGDSRAVLCRGGVAVPLSDDHKPDRPDEMERVEAAGGRVIDWNGCRVLGVLATSRSIGDHYLKPYVISEPEVTVSKRTVLDEFLIVATDGLWDVMSNEVACEVVRKCLHGQIMRKFSEGSWTGEAASMLVGLAMAKGSKDNISVIVVELKKSSCSLS
uniref:protein-serine/threonine phosphatase n=1 Tax=Davidia involucrata TaxID=16924 RepID=A0A5B6YM54_DAVIN